MLQKTIGSTATSSPLAVAVVGAPHAIPPHSPHLGYVGSRRAVTSPARARPLQPTSKTGEIGMVESVGEGTVRKGEGREARWNWSTPSSLHAAMSLVKKQSATVVPT
jgi:hypothetical protein